MILSFVGAPSSGRYARTQGPQLATVQLFGQSPKPYFSLANLFMSEMMFSTFIRNGEHAIVKVLPLGSLYTWCLPRRS